MASNTKPFWQFIKSLKQSSTSVSSLSTINGTATSAIDKADALNYQFQSVFTKEEYGSLSTLKSSPTKSMLQILMSTEGIVRLLKELKQQRACDGPGSIVTTILRTCAELAVSLLQQIFQKSLHTDTIRFA